MCVRCVCMLCVCALCAVCVFVCVCVVLCARVCLCCACFICANIGDQREKAHQPCGECDLTAVKHLPRTHKASRTKTVIDIGDVSLNRPAPTQPEETTGKLRPHANPAQKKKKKAVLAWSRAPSVAHLLSGRVKGRRTTTSIELNPTSVNLPFHSKKGTARKGGRRKHLAKEVEESTSQKERETSLPHSCGRCCVPPLRCVLLLLLGGAACLCLLWVARPFLF